jgi:hypothetical protein
MIAVAACVVLLATNTIGVLRGLPWDWGSAADWFTGFVTLGGFIGAIFAVRLQTKALDLQTDQHEAIASKEKAAENAKLQQAHEAAEEKKWRCARGTSLVITAQRGHNPQLNYVYKQPLTVICEVRAPKGFDLKNVQLTTPSLPSFFAERYPSKTRCDLLEQGRSLRWEMEGPYWPGHYGVEEDAKRWVEVHTSVVFTDPGDVTWTLRGTGELAEVN